MSSTDKALAQVLGELEGFAMPARRDNAAIEAAVADDPDAAPILSAFELERRLAAERARDPFGVARVRRSLGLSQQGFAKRFGVPLATLRQWEQGGATRASRRASCCNRLSKRPLWSSKPRPSCRRREELLSLFEMVKEQQAGAQPVERIEDAKKRTVSPESPESILSDGWLPVTKTAVLH